MSDRRIMVTGGAGFIGSALCRSLVAGGDFVLNVDALTYAGNMSSLAAVDGLSNHVFVEADVCDGRTMRDLMERHRIGAVMHLAAESHVDRSIDAPADFIRTNITGTSTLLAAALDHWTTLEGPARSAFRFVHVSTDEVFGDLGPDEPPFDERRPYAPSSPYAASKAAADHLARAWQRTYGLPVIVTNCSNNYGPYHFPEKLVPLTILNALEEQPLPVYGRGDNVRDWLHVDDHVRGLERALAAGRPGETYLFGGRAERTNLEIVEGICRLLDERRPRRLGRHADLISFVGDRPGHDRRYAIDPAKAERDLAWRAEVAFDAGLARTVDWFIANEKWWRPIRERRYRGQRLGLGR